MRLTSRPPPSPASSRRTALVAAAVCLLCATPLWAATGEYTSLAGLKAAGFQKFFDDAKAQGYTPVYINGYDVGDHTEYAGVAVKYAKKQPFEARYDLTDDDYKDFFKDMSKKGWRAVIVSGYHTKGGPRFAAVWVDNKDKLEWKGKHNQSQKEYEDTVAAMHASGFEPTSVTAYQGADGGAYYTSLFYAVLKDRDQKFENRHDLTVEQLEEQMDKWQSKGFRVIALHAYDTADGLRFLANAKKENNDTNLWQEHHGMTGKQYQKQFDDLAEGWRPAIICGYLDGGEVHFAAVWVARKK